MFENLSIQKRMNYFILMVTLSVFSATIFVYVAMNHIEVKYEHLYKNSMKGAMQTLDIEKNLNYISRTSRDIILGGDYNKNIVKLDDVTAEINTLFSSLQKSMQGDNSLYMVEDAKSSTMLFLNNSLKMMKGLSQEEIKNSKESIIILIRLA